MCSKFEMATDLGWIEATGIDPSDQLQDVINFNRGYTESISNLTDAERMNPNKYLQTQSFPHEIAQHILGYSHGKVAVPPIYRSHLIESVRETGLFEYTIHGSTNFQWNEGLKLGKHFRNYRWKEPIIITNQDSFWVNSEVEFLENWYNTYYASGSDDQVVHFDDFVENHGIQPRFYEHEFYTMRARGNQYDSPWLSNRPKLAIDDFVKELALQKADEMPQPQLLVDPMDIKIRRGKREKIPIQKKVQIGLPEHFVGDENSEIVPL